MLKCPCGSKKHYAHCCEPLHTGCKKAATPEALMRSRYSAYTQGNIDYIQRTMAGKAAMGFNPTDAKAWATTSQWLGLRVVKRLMSKDPSIGFVEFIAKYRKDNQNQRIHELSEFHLIDDIWYYVDGTQVWTNS